MPKKKEHGPLDQGAQQETGWRCLQSMQVSGESSVCWIQGFQLHRAESQEHNPVSMQCPFTAQSASQTGKQGFFRSLDFADILAGLSDFKTIYSRFSSLYWQQILRSLMR